MRINVNGLAATAPERGAGAGGAHILGVSKEQAMHGLLSLILTRAGYQVLTAADGPEACQRFTDHRIDLVLLDDNPPGMDGYAVCAELRKHTAVPILLLLPTWASLEERVKGIELGADGYLTKPFVLPLLRARVCALLALVSKITQATAPPSLTIGAIRLNEGTQQVTVRGQPRHVTTQEFQLLHYLMRHPDRWIAKEELWAILWPAEHEAAPEDDFNRLRVTITRLRQKIEEDPAHPRYLQNRHGVGYQFCSGSPA